jgi:hypothetical protein
MKGSAMERTPISLPPMTQQPILQVDMTPDVFLPRRILEAYAENCRCKWEVNGLSEEECRVWEMMNQHQKERLAIIEKALRRLD